MGETQKGVRPITTMLSASRPFRYSKNALPAQPLIRAQRWRHNFGESVELALGVKDGIGEDPGQ